MPSSDTSPVWIGFDLGGTKMMAVVYDDSETPEPLGRRRRKTKGAEGSESGIERICTTIERALEDADVDASRIAGIGIGCPGPVDPLKGVIRTAVNLGWDEVPIGKELTKRFGCPAWVLNDVDAGVFGEYRFGAGMKSYCTVGIFPGTGIGGGCVYDDRILHGRNITCMEIGHTKVTESSRASGFAMTGTLESEASRLTIAAEAAKAAYRGDAPNLLREVGTDLSDIRSGALAASVEKGDKAIRELIVNASRTIGFAVVNMVHLLAPDCIVLGGGLVEAMEELIVSTVRETAQEHCLPPYRNTFKVTPAKLGDDASVLGAAAWAKKMTTVATS